MKKKLRVILLLILVSFTLCIMSNTYSRYVADTTGDVEALFSKWQILVNDNDITTNQNTSFKLVPIIDENNNVKANRLAPSSTGYFDIEIDPTLVDVSFDYEISFNILKSPSLTSIQQPLFSKICFGLSILISTPCVTIKGKLYFL